MCLSPTYSVMAVQEPPLGLGAERPPPPPARSSDLTKDVHPLGEALKARAADVLDLTGARIRGLGHGGDAGVQSSFERINRNSTSALASFLAGEGLDVSRRAGKETGKL